MEDGADAALFTVDKCYSFVLRKHVTQESIIVHFLIASNNVFSSWTFATSIKGKIKITFPLSSGQVPWRWIDRYRSECITDMEIFSGKNCGQRIDNACDSINSEMRKTHTLLLKGKKCIMRAMSASWKLPLWLQGEGQLKSAFNYMITTVRKSPTETMTARGGWVVLSWAGWLIHS